MKAFTDFEQSKRLAEFLSLDSADMRYELDKGVLPQIHYFGGKNELPCWSLAALLEILPKRIEIAGSAYSLGIYLYGLYYWNVSNGEPHFEVAGKDNLVDACVEMIEKLHEQNLI